MAAGCSAADDDVEFRRCRISGGEERREFPTERYSPEPVYLLNRKHEKTLMYPTDESENWIDKIISDKKNLFTPTVHNSDNKTTYRFCPSRAGKFCCSLTGLVFIVERTEEVVYSVAPWDRDLQGWSQAGPLFEIKCPEGTLKELHLPHCECEMPRDTKLSVAHVRQDKMEVLQPWAVTKTHVIVGVTHLSFFGLIRRFFSKKIRGQVLLFLRPEGHLLNMFLLPLNVPPDQVRMQTHLKGNVPVPTSSTCSLVHDMRYSVHPDMESMQKIQPETEKFECDFGPTFHPTYEIFLLPYVEDVELSLWESGTDNKVVWERTILLKEHFLWPKSSLEVSHSSNPAVNFVDTHRADLIQRVTPVEPILDELFAHIHAESYAHIRAAPRPQEMMRRLYEVLHSGGKSLKIHFYKALQKHSQGIVEELELS